jgi:N-acetylmuramoyl-L-alanine amidase
VGWFFVLVEGGRLNRQLSSILLLTLLVVGRSLAADPVLVQGTRVWTDPEKTRLVFETTGAVTHRIFAVDDPDRLVLDLDNVRLTSPFPTVDLADPVLVGLRAGPRNSEDIRIVLDLKQAVRAKSFLLTPNERYQHRLVIDLTPKDGVNIRRVARPAYPAIVPDARPGGRGGPTWDARGRPIIVAIDAGHGGEDPGAIGKGGTQEKTVTLSIARELAKLIEREPGLEPLMTRDGDYYVGLRDRIKIARDQRADLFVSIHADAFTNTTARGSSVYTLSNSGASSASAKWLANRENSSDRMGGIARERESDILATVLMDMTQNATIEQSSEAAGLVLAHLGRLGTVHKNYVQKAGFVVLESPDVPSILVETAFISNPDEEKRLNDKRHQRRFAEAIMAGVKAYFLKFPPHGVVVDAGSGSAPTARAYVISPGDTLSGIAKRHSVSVPALRAHNGLTDDVIRVGQVLTIPEDS